MFLIYLRILHPFFIFRKQGETYWDDNYKFEFGKADFIREGKDVTIIASGATLFDALKAHILFRIRHRYGNLVVYSAGDERRKAVNKRNKSLRGQTCRALKQAALTDTTTLQ